MSDRRAQLAFVKEFLYFRGAMLYHGYVRRDPMAQLHLRAGGRPVPIYDRLAGEGTLVADPAGQLADTSHPVCQRGAAGPALRGQHDRRHHERARATRT